jgi:hypothetical protein
VFAVRALGDSIAVAAVSAWALGDAGAFYAISAIVIGGLIAALVTIPATATAA